MVETNLHIQVKILGVTNFRTKSYPKLYLAEIIACPNVCHAVTFYDNHLSNFATTGISKDL